ncbi:hypothetical protein FB45DRAFT_1040800 [Roridomyces roridus]|uniref:Uncharacterized protein n=1 Tax=Roridomyces roridus TaxID=1738132 RepID=A0AAD7B0X4_9AGAR|nr:hypothetical protein FB45DRAFT_1040800 [Roridomyces roridus]
MLPTKTKKFPASRRENVWCKILDPDADDIFAASAYSQHWPHTWQTPDTPTNQLLNEFDAAAPAGLKAFEAIAKLSRRLIRIDVAVTSKRGMLLDILEPLSSEYDCLVGAVLQGLSSLAHYLLLRRVPLKDYHSRPRFPIVDLDETVGDWERALAEMEIHANAITKRWPEVIDVLRTKLETLSEPQPLFSWLRWTNPQNVKSDIAELTNDLSKMVQTCTSEVVELMQAYAAVDLAFQKVRRSASANNLYTIGFALRELIRLDSAVVRYRAGFWIMSRLAVEQHEEDEMEKSPLRDLLIVESDYLFEHSPRPENLWWLKSYQLHF